MAVLIMAPELQLPWESSGPEDKRFYRMLRNWLLGLVALAVLVPILPVAERIRDQSEQLPPQLARVILEKQALPEPVPVQPKPTPQPRPVEPAAVKPKPAEQKPVDKPKPVQQTRANATDTMEQARDAAAVAGVLPTVMRGFSEAYGS